MGTRMGFEDPWHGVCRDEGLLRVLDYLRPFTAPLFAWAAAVGRGTARLPWSVSSLLRQTMSTRSGWLVW